VLLSVHCVHSDEVSRARDVLIAAGAEDVASSGEESINIEDEAGHVLELPSDLYA
jgi:hypothetical protein